MSFGLIPDGIRTPVGFNKKRDMDQTVFNRYLNKQKLVGKNIWTYFHFLLTF